jgi:hypothetical protein
MNTRNEHEWPDAIRSHHLRRNVSTILWARILGDCLIGPHILPVRDSGCNCLNFLRTHLSGILETVSLTMRLHVWCGHNSAPSQWLSENYPRR